MMSRCTICGTPTDLALIDVLAQEEVIALGGGDKVPLIGTCGERKCVEQQLDRIREQSR